MEKHIFRFGNSSLGIIVPKKWADKCKLNANSPVYVSENNKGDLVLSAVEQGEVELAKSVSRKIPPEVLVRWIAVYYMYGVGKLRIVSEDGFTDEQASAVQKEIKDECPGFEVIAQTNSEIRIEDLTNLKEIDLDKILMRLSSLLQQEFLEIEQGNYSTVGRLEELVDRFYMLGIRYVNIVQPSNMIKYYRTIQLAEMIADNLETLFSIGVEPRYKAIIAKLHRELDLIFKGFGGDDKAIAEVSALTKELRESIASMRTDPIHKKLLKEVATYMAQISELGLLRENEEPFV
ncbi:MAG: hypothetical protein ABSD68_01050 [Candidatus Micrarchaeales archaeon]|jgi:antitoxin component of MazEF toxin-antitoxin module